MTIVPFLKERVFGPQDIQAMSTALEDVCNILNVAADGQRAQLANKIITLADQDQCNAAHLRDRILRDIASGQEEWAAVLVRAARRGAL